MSKKRQKRTGWIAKPFVMNSFGDKNLFAQVLRDVFQQQVKGIVTEFSGIIGLKKQIVSRAFRGGSITTQNAKTISEALGYEINQLFIYPKSGRR